MQLKQFKQRQLWKGTVRNTEEVFSECSELKNTSSVPKANLLWLHGPDIVI